MTIPVDTRAPRKPRSCLGIGCGIIGAAGAAVFAIGVVAAVTTHPTPHATTSISAPGPVASTRPGAPPTTAPTTAPAAATVLHATGNGIKTTPAFTTTDQWTIAYTYDCSNFGDQGNLQIFVDYPGGDIAANALGRQGHDSTTETGVGTHTLTVNSECVWTVTVTNQ